jgi:hypothetical protein
MKTCPNCDSLFGYGCTAILNQHNLSEIVCCTKCVGFYPHKSQIDSGFDDPNQSDAGFDDLNLADSGFDIDAFNESKLDGSCQSLVNEMNRVNWQSYLKSFERWVYSSTGEGGTCHTFREGAIFLQHHRMCLGNDCQ